MLLGLKLSEGMRGRIKLPQRERLLLIGAFAAVYIIWGSTYLGIKIAVQTLPPFLMAAARFMIAGSILFFGSLIAGAAKPSVIHWKDNAVLGFFLLLMGNGGIVWASDKLPSGIIALLVTIEPVWVILLMVLAKQGKLPGIKTVFGIVLGFAGSFLLLSPGLSGAAFTIDISGLVAIVISTMCWAIGSLYAVKANKGTSAIMATGMQMLLGSFYMLIAGTIRGEWFLIHPENFSEASVYAFIYLIFFGSIIGYSSFSYLVKVASPSQVATAAYVNPLVAVTLGTFIGKEPFTMQIALAALLLLAGVILVLSTKKETSA